MKQSLRTVKEKRAAKLEEDIAEHEQAIARNSGGGESTGLAEKDAQSKLEMIGRLFDRACAHWADDSGGETGAAKEDDDAKAAPVSPLEAAPARPQVRTLMPCATQ